MCLFVSAVFAAFIEAIRPTRLSPHLPPPCSVFLEERMGREGAYSEALEADAQELKRLMGLGNKEAAEIENEVKTATYK